MFPKFPQANLARLDQYSSVWEMTTDFPMPPAPEFSTVFDRSLLDSFGVKMPWEMTKDELHTAAKNGRISPHGDDDENLRLLLAGQKPLYYEVEKAEKLVREYPDLCASHSDTGRPEVVLYRRDKAEDIKSNLALIEVVRGRAGLADPEVLRLFPARPVQYVLDTFRGLAFGYSMNDICKFITQNGERNYELMLLQARKAGIKNVMGG